MQSWTFGLGAAVLAAAVVVGLGCGDGDEARAGAEPSQASAAAPAEVKAESNYITGKVTMPDGSPLRGDIKDITISISGVSEAAEKVSYSPAVKPDGTYRQKVAGGQYRFSPSTITVLFNNNEFRFPLEPVGSNWNKNQDAADGIVQNFVWKPTGPTPYGQSSGLDTNNATHWYGMSIGLRADGWRNDINKAPTPIPDGSRLIFTLVPKGKTIDGQDLKEPIKVEREHKPTGLSNVDINDIPPAEYELSGVAKLPDGTEKPLLLQGKNDYPGYKPAVPITVEKDNILGAMWKQPISFVID